MKFCEAMDLLSKGSKVTRMPWKDGIYFKYEEGQVNSYQPKLSQYIYDEDIMVSDSWLVEGIENPMSFCEIIPYLQKGIKAKMESWDDGYIYYDQSSKGLLIQTMMVFQFLPDFASFVAEDWIEVEDKKEAA